MAENTPPASPESQVSSEQEKAALRQKSKGKIRTIRIWLWIIALLFLSFGLLSRCALNSAQLQSTVVDSCVKNMPYSPQWEQDLAKHGLSGQSERIILPYCRCVWEEPLNKLSEHDIRHFPEMSAQEQLAKLGGEAAFLARQTQCLAAQKTP